MATYTIRWSADRSIYFVEPAAGRNARGFWLSVEKLDAVSPALIKNPYSGAFAFDGGDDGAASYFRRWFSMRGFIVRQGLPQTGVAAASELVRDYLSADKLVTHESLKKEALSKAPPTAAATSEPSQGTAQRVARRRHGKR